MFAFGAPVSFVTYNGSQFTAHMFEFVCIHLGVHHELTTTYHPRRMAKRNGLIVHCLQV